ncbi:hypothetical protein BJX62DRAFT_236591 [Aspergillus germanicus]
MQRHPKSLGQTRSVNPIVWLSIPSGLQIYEGEKSRWFSISAHPKITQKHSPLAAIAFGDKARVYAQVGAGEILEYQYDGSKWTKGPVIAKAKEGTPLAVAAKGTDYICVYYVDEENITQEVSGSKTWKEGTLSQLNYKVHPQSKLAAGWYDELSGSVKKRGEKAQGLYRHQAIPGGFHGSDTKGVFRLYCVMNIRPFLAAQAKKLDGITGKLWQMAADAAQQGPPRIQLVQISQSDKASRKLDTEVVNPDSATTQLNNMHPNYLGDRIFMDLEDEHWQEWWFKTDTLGNGGEFQKGWSSEQMYRGPIAATQVQDEQINVFGHWWNDPYHINGWSHNGRGADWNATLVN